MDRYVRWFREIGIEDTETVGGKNASLGEMYRHLTEMGVRVPNGFAVTAEAYRYVLRQGDTQAQLQRHLSGLDYEDVAALQRAGEACRNAIESQPLPADLADAILEAYRQLRSEYGADLSVAVRSSATAEDSPEASFAGQNESYLNITTEADLLRAYTACLASNFTDRSLHYKHLHGFAWSEVFVSVVVMKLVRADRAASGVMFSLDTDTGFEDVVLINAAYGLGENIVQGTIDPDTFYVHKPTFQQGHRAVLKRRIGRKEKMMVLSDTRQNTHLTDQFTRNVPTTPVEQNRFCITDEEVMILADYAIKIESHYSARAGHPVPMDMEWAKDGIDGHLYMVQARPETVASKTQRTELSIYRLTQRGEVLLRGHAIGTRIGAGRVRRITDVSQMQAFRPGEVLVAESTSPDWEPIMKIAAAIVTNHGGRTCHAAIVSRELGIPAVLGAEHAMERLTDGQEVTVSCAEGETGYVYAGKLPYDVEHTDLSHLPTPRTEVMMNLGNPDLAFALAHLPVAGIGLARMEFIINEYIRAHPMALLHPERLDRTTRTQLEKVTAGYATASDYFVLRLSEGIATLAASVYPRPCVVRMSDFKSNEYATLLGGDRFEPHEENPMLGFRGAARYSHPAYEEGFALECAAIKRVRETMGLDNVIVMIPFCRRVDEAERTLETMARYGLERGQNGLKIYMMCEIPNNVIQIDAFSRYFDGISIGSNDLTQMTLGVDRDNEQVAFDYDERDPGVLAMIEMAIKGARRNGIHSGLCGQAPSDYPEVAALLVKLGIDSMSLNPDSVLRTLPAILQHEQA